MRLNHHQRTVIAQSAQRFFGADADVRLFGSRLDDNQRGGDIDLLIETSAPLAPEDLADCRNRFIADLYGQLGEQRIDVLIVPQGLPDARPVVQSARQQGQPLSGRRS
jgi:predicted nucleotidyltransferase